MEDNVLKQLAELKKHYQKKHVSVMVGAGFSKNACPEFPSWNELLYDMVDWMYQDDIEAAFLRHLKINPSVKMSFDSFKKRERDRIILQKGPLKVVSEYVERKGFRESIEHYIEERIPYIDKENSEFRFTGKHKDKSIRINPEHFSAHISLVKCVNWVKIYTTNYDRLLEYAAGISGVIRLKPITKAKDLSISSDDPVVIKLHGDLYQPDEKQRDFRFDGNLHQQYIISAEDYKNYPKDHEAFTQLMRISLLQGVFCLIGFSGDDPNFVNWIEWVRDIIEREENSDKDQQIDYKIYLISLSKEVPSPEKKIFYDNHRIVCIPILRGDVLKEINASSTDEYREVFCRFFEYIERQNYPQQSPSEEIAKQESTIRPDGTIDSKQDGKKDGHVKDGGEKKYLNNAEPEIVSIDRNEYQSLWNKVYHTNITGTIPNLTHILTIEEDTLDRLEEIKIWNRFVNYSDQQKRYLSVIENKNELSENEARLALLALQDTGIPVDEKWVKLISESSIGKPYLHVLNGMIHRSETLSTIWGSEETISIYERVLRSLFSLDFSAALELLKGWKPIGPDVLKKAMLLYFFEKDEAKDLLTDYIENETNIKERFYATRLLNLVVNVFPQKYSLSKYYNANVQDYAEVLSNCLKKVQESKEKILRYGDGHNQKVLFMDGKPNKYVEAIAVLYFMMEAPSLPSYRNFYNYVNETNWYPVHKNLFESYPFAILFYDILCLDKKARSRMGQDYAYSDNLRDTCLDKLLNNLLKAFLSEGTPFYLKEGILTISSELFVSVPAVKWDGMFMQIWDNVIAKNRFDNKDDRLNDTLDVFIEKGLNSLTDKSSRQRVIVDVLTNSKKDTGFAINCLYYLHVLKRDRNNNQSLLRTVSEFVTSIDKPEEITIAGNIYRILTDEQKNEVAEKCVEILRQNQGVSIETVVYQSAQFFVKDDAVKRKIYIESVCNSPLLWNNGIAADGHFSTFDFLKVTGFVRRIRIDKQALLIIYDKMKVSLDELNDFFTKHKSLFLLGNVDGLVAEMLSFLNYFEKRLRTEKDYDDYYNKTKSFLQKITGVKNTEDGLLSQYEDDLRDAMSFIYVNREVLSHKEVVSYASIIVNRVLLRNGDGLDSCIDYLRLYFEGEIIGKDDEALMNGLVGILDRYNKDIAQNCNMNVVMVTNDMAKIGKMLKKIGYSSNGIDYWMNLKNSGRFMTNFN